MRKKTCPRCNEFVDSNSKFCVSCGQKLEELEKPKKEKIKDASVVKDKSNISSILISIIITLLVCLLGFTLFYRYYLKNLVVETTKIEKSVTVTESGIADAVDKVYDSVVVVENYKNGSLYATGTGFVYKEDNDKGYILTNYHVIDGATDIYVVFTNNERVKVKAVGGDEYSDIAVVSVDKDKVLAIADIGSSEDARVGDTMFTVGAPVDSSTYSWSVTRGILSGKNRLVEVSSQSNYSTSVMEVLQTDAAINSGNSGGPLCNSNGQVIGITNMKLASETIEGMGFAIPIEVALQYADVYVNGGVIERPYIGVSIYDSVKSIFNTSSGLYIDSVIEGGPADVAGLKKGDRITKVGDTEVSSAAYFKFALYKYKIGDKVEITYERNGKEKVAEVVLASSSSKY